MEGIPRFMFHASRRGKWLLLVLLILGLIPNPVPASAQSAHHAALIVDFGDGRVVVRVVAFAGESISGLELLQESGLDVAVMINPGGGAALCAVEGVGCAPTPQDCFCQCRGTPCRYWSYFHLQDGDWVYAGMGTADHVLRDGDVDGWVWSDGQTPPPLLTWEEIWAQGGVAQPTAPLPLPTATPLPPATAVPPTVAPAQSTVAPTQPVSTHTLTPVSSPTVSSTALLTPTRSSVPPTAGPATPTAGTAAAAPSPLGQEPSRSIPASTSQVETSREGIPWGPLAAFGGLVLLLVALALWLRRRR